MIASLIQELGPWNWMALGAALLIFELFLPGVFLLWIGIAAILVGTLSLQLWNMGFWTWQLQVLIFLVLSLLSAYAGSRIMAARRDDSDQPLLNRRSEQMIGRTATLTEPISEGRGRIKLGDTMWRVSGPDLPVGARVRVVAAEDSELVVEAV
ncbi:membrane protein implicated in regulation of membrane protease activity [Mesorhizobium soli]|uniref:NfeD family protein n=1 Tax=Pseudaminobacter soli (ex Li et al. 2025) TaxID=1295366 RepID=UPI002473FA28|nr:NfeD family protein [Mesorhizobium soli]MDH6233488.1 membrane protein implicated in regulation of membrane protease activity [Mesorhizobium soli]